MTRNRPDCCNRPVALVLSFETKALHLALRKPQVPTTDWITLTLAIASELTLPLGSASDGSPVALDLTNNPHTLLVGPCSSGKTVLLRNLARSCMAAGAKTVVIDPIRRGLGFRDLGVDVVATSREEVNSELEALVSEIARRQGLPEEVRKAEAAQPIVLFIDEYASIVHPMSAPKGIDPDDDYYREVQEHNAEA